MKEKRISKLRLALSLKEPKEQVLEDLAEAGFVLGKPVKHRYDSATMQHVYTQEEEEKEVTK